MLSHGPPPPPNTEPPFTPNLTSSFGSTASWASGLPSPFWQMPHINLSRMVSGITLAVRLPACKHPRPIVCVSPSLHPSLEDVAMASSRQTILVVLATVLCVASYAEGQILFSKLPKSLIVTATMADGGPISEVRTGEDIIMVSWSVNTTAAPITTATKVRTKLCFAKESQVLRGWRKTTDDLKKDKTCLYNIALAPYSTTGATANYKLPRSIPGAKYFVRAYALDASGHQVAFGGTSPDRVTNTFTVIPITGRHKSIDIAVGIFSVFSVASLLGFFILESIWLKRKKSV